MDPEPTKDARPVEDTVGMTPGEHRAARIVPSELGPYRVSGELGRGGMGVVYSALDTRLNRHVAVKMLPDAFANDAAALDNLVNEARMLASLNHPNIATIHSLESHGGFRFFTLELIEGMSLAEAPGMSVAKILHVFRQIASALSVAHAKGVIHCDLKPANILMAARETPKILDFGIARAVEREPGAADAEEKLSGTPGYMSPEQILGRPLDHRVDIWAFGCLLYEALTGTRAFPGINLDEVLASTLHDEPDLTRLPPELPDTVRNLIAGCLEKDRCRRLAEMSGAEDILAGVASSFRWREADRALSRTLQRALGPGDPAAGFDLCSGVGTRIRSEELLAMGPLVISFYRGRWCPVCTAQLVSFQQLHQQIGSLGASLVAITPQLDEHNRSLAAEQGLTYPVLSDPGNEIARAYGVAFALPDDLREFYIGLGLDLKEFNGDDSWVLPIPATFVVGRDGVVHYSVTSPDPTHRPDPELALQALRQLRAR